MEWLTMRGWPISHWLRWLSALTAGLLVSVFAGIILGSSPTFATEATWEGDNILYEGDLFKPLTDTGKKTILGRQENEAVYLFVPPDVNPPQAVIIYFEAGVNPKQARQAKRVVNEFENGAYKAWPPIHILVIPPPAQNPEEPPDTGGSSCKIESVGWLICGPSLWIAGGMDWAYKGIVEFLKVKPLEGERVDLMYYQAWNIMRSFANLAFILVFLVIIYSQLTSLGISAYGIKKLAPRLLIAAIMVNMSFIICAFLIDLSNIGGAALKGIFDNIIQLLVQNGTSAKGLDLAGTVQAFLSGGALVVGAISITGGSVILGAAPFALPIFLTLFLSLIVALLVLSVRQALIVILVIISPLAFVCYLLPGTEKWFERWRSTFFTMLIFFPAFSVVFGGSQLAGILITSNPNGSIVIAILGIIVQLAPLAITPLILKLGGGVLNRFAGIVNDPTRGFIDRSKQWARDTSQDIANRRSYGNENLGRRHFIRRATRSMNHRSRALKERLANSESLAEKAYQGSALHRGLNMEQRDIEQDKDIIDKQLDFHWGRYQRTNRRALEKDLRLRTLESEVSAQKDALDNRYLEFTAGVRPRVDKPEQFDALLRRAQDASTNLAVESMRKENAQRFINNRFAEEMLANESLQKQAGGIHKLGADSALSSAIATMRHEFGKSVEDGAQILKHFSLSAKQRQQHALGHSVTAVDKDGNVRTFEADSSYTRDAAIQEQIAVGTVPEIAQIVALSGSDLADFKGTISSSLASSPIKNKAPFLGGKLVDEIIQGNIVDMAALENYVLEWVNEGKFKASDVSVLDRDAMKLLLNSIGPTASHPKRKTIKRETLIGLGSKIDEVFDNPILYSNVADNVEKTLRNLRRSLPKSKRKKP